MLPQLLPELTLTSKGIENICWSELEIEIIAFLINFLILGSSFLLHSKSIHHESVTTFLQIFCSKSLSIFIIANLIMSAADPWMGAFIAALS